MPHIAINRENQVPSRHSQLYTVVVDQGRRSRWREQVGKRWVEIQTVGVPKKPTIEKKKSV